MSLIRGDARHIPLLDACVDCCVTSPPYFGLRDYGTARWTGGDPACNHAPDKRGSRFASPVSTKQASNTGSGTASRCDCDCGATRIDAQIGLEPTPDAYVAALVAVFREVRRVLKDDGTVWLNLGDSYAAERGGTTPPAETLAGGAGGWMPDGSRVNRDRFDGYNPTRHASRIGLKHKDLVGIPWRVAFALQADGWYLRSDIIWHKPNPMPESVTDRPTKAHEYVFLLSKQPSYYYDAAAIAEPASKTGTLKHLAGGGGERAGSREGLRRDEWIARKRLQEPGFQALTDGEVLGDPLSIRNKRSVWTVATMPYAGAHFATMPEKLIEPCILAGCPLGGLVLDPFVGSGTVVAVAERLGRRGVGMDLTYHDLSRERTAQRGLSFVMEPDAAYA